MAYSNNVMIIRHELLSKLVRLWYDGELVEKIDSVPIEMIPRHRKERIRCCRHKERAVLRYKMFPLLGLDMTDEVDEVTPLSYYAKQALEERQRKDSLLCVVDEACTSCVEINYEVSNLCRGCVSKACYNACPKKCISFKKNGQAEIDHDDCISCGRCHGACPYHAIVYIPVPCEASCPVGAIKKDEHGIEHIDESRCIYCGSCINACPFGAIFEVSQVFDVLREIKAGEKVIAIVAPAILAQYDAPHAQVYGALKRIGFSDVIEVAQGAMDTVHHEGHELLEKLEAGQSFMTTSCCPSFYEAIDKHIPKLHDFVSDSKSPMYYTAERARAKYPNGKIVFIGPCVAKRKEARREGQEVDYVMTFEEIASIFSALEIDLKNEESFLPEVTSVREAHGFAQNGGVMGAVQSYLRCQPETADKVDKVTTEMICNIDKKTLAKLKGYAVRGTAPAQFIEVMCCPGGCVNGPSAHNHIVAGRKQLAQEISTIPLTYADLPR